MLNTMIVVTVTPFSGTTSTDKNGRAPVMLQCIAGTMPNRNVLSGTVAERSGLEVGKSYLVNVRENGNDAIFGEDFTFLKITELTSGLDIVKASKEIGEPRIQVISRPEGFANAYERKGDAVESLRTKRIRQGLYQPSYNTTVLDHETATVVKDGSSVNSGGKILLNTDEQKERAKEMLVTSSVPSIENSNQQEGEQQS